ncbi:MAG TPA: hypothetical protein VHS06_03245, partial [Chloroflexota bacterium]|nr:hypothetical protein [Chloroflexota bacterium]
MAGSQGMRAAGWITLVGAVVGMAGVALFSLALLPAGVLSRPVRAQLVTGGGAFLILGGLVFSLGLVLYLFLPLAGGGARAKREYGSHRVVAACTVFAAILGNLGASAYFLLLPHLLGSTVGRTDMSGRVLSPEGIVVAALSLDLALLAVVYLRIVRPGAVTFEEMGLDFHGVFGRFLMGILFGLLLFAASSLVEYLLGLAGVRQTQQESFQSITRASPNEFGLVLLAGAAVAPFAEEEHAMERMMTVKEVAAYLKLNPITVYRY